MEGNRSYHTVQGRPPFFFNIIAQEQAVRGTHLGLSRTQPAPLPVCMEATLQTALLFNIVR